MLLQLDILPSYDLRIESKSIIIVVIFFQLSYSKN